MPEHLASRPSWDCATCEEPWPCPGAKEALVAEFAGLPTSLRVYLAACFVEAGESLTAHGQPLPADLYDRFLAWVTTDRL